MTTSPACSRSTRPARCWARRIPASRSAAGKSTPGRYFHVAEPGSGWGGTNVMDPLEIVTGFDAEACAGPVCAC